MPYVSLNIADVDQTIVIAAGAGAPLNSVGETLASMRAELLLMLGGRNDINNTRLDRWINQAYLEMADSLDLAILEENLIFTVNSGSQTIALNTLIQSVKSLTTRTGSLTTGQATDRPLDYLAVDTFRKYPDASGPPDYYTFLDNVIAFYPTPTSAEFVSLDAVILPRVMDNGTHSSILGRQWDEALLLLARSKAHRALDEFDEAGEIYNVYLSHVRNKKDRKADQRSSEVAAFRPARSRLDRMRINRTNPGDY